MLILVTHEYQENRNVYNEFLFQDKASLELFLKNNVYHPMSTLVSGKSFNIKLYFVDCKIYEYTLSSVSKRVKIFDSSENECLYNSNYVMQGFSDEFYYAPRLESKLFIPTSCETLFHRLRDLCDMYNKKFKFEE